MLKSEKDIIKLNPLFPFFIRSMSSGIIYLDLPDFYQILLLKKGKVQFNSSGRSHTIPEMHVIFIPPTTAISATNSADCEMIQIAFGQQFIDSIIISGIDEKALHQFNLDSNNQETDQSMIYIPLDTTVFSEISQLTVSLTDEFIRKSQGYQSMIRIKFMELLLAIYRINPPPIEDHIKTGHNAGENINKITEFIYEKYSDSLTLNAIAGHFGLNPSYLSRIFKEETGTALFEYINKIRVQKSCMLLKRTSMTIIEIAFSVGYNNISHFNRYFRRIMKMSPREYKNYIKK
jgi:AraC-like DNA-binding protein